MAEATQNEQGSELQPNASGMLPGDEPERETQPVDAEAPPRLPFAVVGIGASAGGIEAFREFLKAMAPDSGMAFVFILHLSPDRHSFAAEVLSKHTQMPVVEAANSMAVEPNHVYVIAPAHVLTIKDGFLHLGPRLDGPRAANRPIDDFFKSLAQEQRERAIAIILSGMGSNGTAGTQAIKAVGGLCIAQEPESAQYPSMPRHLIDAGYSDFIARPGEMPDILLQYIHHPYASGGREENANSILQREQQHVREILAVLRTRLKQDFNGYKKPTVLRRIQRRMGLARVTQIGDYAKVLRQSPNEISALADDLLIHVTGFFRDPEAWETLRTQVIVPLVLARETGGPVRCWITACSSGEEAYSLAMLLTDESERAGKQLDIKVFATDMAERTLASARSGTYPGGIEADISPDFLTRFFEKDDAMYRIRQDLRERVVFAPQNVLQDPPFSRLDIVTCRNLLIYLEPAVQQRVLALLHFGLREGGTLFLGSSETLGDSENLFEPIDKKARIFRRVGPTRHGMVDFPLPQAMRLPRDFDATNGGEGMNSAGRRLGHRPTLAQLTQRTLVDLHVPAAVLVDRDFNILYFQGETRPFLEQPSGEPTRDLMNLAVNGVRGAVRIALHRAAATNGPATADDGWIETEPGTQSRVSVTASPIIDKAAGDLFVVSFDFRNNIPAAQDGAVDADPDDADTEDLRRIRDELQNAVEELQTSNEELKASHEEVVSVNEEIQSTNEELETSKEEMQSLNEELTTVNSQLRAKMDEHQSTSNDLASLLTSTAIAVLFLDPNFRIRRFTPAVKDLLELISSDVGRPLSDLAKKFTDPHLQVDGEAVLERLVPIEREVVTQDGRWFLRRITPYRTADSRIDGVVITFLDITARRNGESVLREAEAWRRGQRAAQEAALNGASLAGSLEPLVHTATDMFGEGTRAAFYLADAEGKILHHVVGMSADYAAAVNGFKIGGESLACGLATHKGESVITPDVMTDPLWEPWREMAQRFDYRGCWSFPIKTSAGKFVGTLAIYWRQPRHATQHDIQQISLLIHTAALIIARDQEHTARQRAETAVFEGEERFRLVVQGARDFAMMLLDNAGVITAWNAGAELLLGWTAKEAIGQPASIIFTAEDKASGTPELELTKSRTTGHAEDERWHVRKDSSRFWGSGVMTALHSEDGSVRGFVKVFRDNSARQQLITAQTEALTAAERANHSKDEFLATLSHELRTPLSAILLWANMLKGDFDRETLDEGLAAIRNSAEAQRQLVDDLLDSSRIASGNLRLQMKRTELSSVIQTAVEAVLPTAQIKGVRILVDNAPNVGTMFADPDRLRQIIWNLLTNSVKFTSLGGQVKISSRRRKDEVEISVTDNGQGIPATFLPHVFELFRQADSAATRNHGGLGLGLAICKKLVEQHGGTITAASEGRDKGSAFIVTLPSPPLPEVNTPVATGRTSHLASLEGVNVLLVEDDKETRNALTSILRHSGAAVTSVGSAAAGLSAFKAMRTDVLISDIGMPGEDGYSLMRQIRAHETMSNSTPVPAIALTAFVSSDDQNKAAAVGFNKHLGKPIEPEELLAAVQSLLMK